MAFNDPPVVDNASKHSEHSETHLKIVMNQQSGFICRQEIPDKGLDFDVEMIEEGKFAVNRRFGLQLKSIESPTYIKSGKFISYPFTCSRLGYMLNRKPGLGIIVLYDVGTDKLFFDYIDDIYLRLMDDHGDDSWKEKETINIRIPVENELNDQSIANIHEYFTNRFKVLYVALDSPKYGLGDNANPLIRPESIEDVRELLSKYGLLLLHQYDFGTVYKLMAKLPHQELIQNKDMLLIAAVTYSEVGMFADSVFYLSKLKRLTDLNEDEENMLAFTALKNDQAMRKVNNEVFIQRASELMAKYEAGSINYVMLLINICFYRVLALKSLHDIPTDLAETIINLFTQIDALPIDEETKLMLAIWNLDNYSVLTSHRRHRLFGNIRIAESLNNTQFQQSNLEQIKSFLQKQQEFFAMIDGIFKRLTNFENQLLRANVISVRIRFTIAREIDNIAFDFGKSEMGKVHQTITKNNIVMASKAFNIYLDLGHVHQAYVMLCNLLELVIDSRDYYHYTDDLDLPSLLARKQLLETQLGMDNPYELQIPQLIAKQADIDISQADDNHVYLTMDEQEIENFAKVALRAWQLPEERLQNIIDEIKAHRLFHQRSPDDQYQLLQYPSQDADPAILYKFPNTYIIKSKSTGIETPPSFSVETLLRQINR